jgi:hypothetical protein
MRKEAWVVFMCHFSLAVILMLLGTNPTIPLLGAVLFYQIVILDKLDI